MRLTVSLASLACAALAASAPALMPAAAQAGYYGYAPGGGVNQHCVNTRRNNQAAGAVAGAILGGVLGSNVAARGHRGDGTALGAVVGGVIGSEVGRGNTQCRTEVYGPPPAYSGYGYDAYPTAGAPYGYGGGEPYSQPYGVQDPYYQNETFGRDYRYDEPLAGAPGRPYTEQYRNDEFAGRECAGAKQITRLPDGTEIHKPVEACREAYYGGWTVRD